MYVWVWFMQTAPVGHIYHVYGKMFECNMLKNAWYWQNYEMMRETWMTCLSVWASCLSEPQRTLDCGYNQNLHVLLLKDSLSLLMCIWQYLWSSQNGNKINQMCEVNSLCHLSLSFKNDNEYAVFVNAHQYPGFDPICGSTWLMRCTITFFALLAKYYETWVDSILVHIVENDEKPGVTVFRFLFQGTPQLPKYFYWSKLK